MPITNQIIKQLDQKSKSILTFDKDLTLVYYKKFTNRQYYVLIYQLILFH